MNEGGPGMSDSPAFDPGRRPSLVLTIGHSNRSLEDFIGLLKAQGANMVVDVRKMPRSRANPQFNIDALPEALREADIDYVHIPGLGGLRPRSPSKSSPNVGWRNASFRAYADYMLTPAFEESLNEMMSRSALSIPALMCAEAVPWRCHRSLIADALVVRGIDVEDIIGGSRASRHVLRPWARVEGTRITYPPEAAGPGAEEEDENEAGALGRVSEGKT